MCCNKLTVLRTRKEGLWNDPSTCAPREVALVLSLAVLLTRFIVCNDNKVITRRVLWAGWFACEGAEGKYSRVLWAAWFACEGAEGKYSRVLWAGWFTCEGAEGKYSSNQKGGRVEKFVNL